jgi:hypothetical protein
MDNEEKLSCLQDVAVELEDAKDCWPVGQYPDRHTILLELIKWISTEIEDLEAEVNTDEE